MPDEHTTSDAFSTAGVDDIEPEFVDSAGAMNANLISTLGCTKMHPRVWFLSPGDSITYHRHTEQEELYYSIDGPGRLRIENEIIDVPERTAVRVPPETNRQLINDTDADDHIWLAIGAPALKGDQQLLDED